MLWKNTADRFGHVSVLIHWLVALTVYGMFALGLWMVTLGYYDVWYHGRRRSTKASARCCSSSW